MSTCANCGQALPEGTAFCAACGAPAGAAARTAGPPTPADQAATQVLPPGADQMPTGVLPVPGPAATQVMPPGAAPLSGAGAPGSPASPPSSPPPGVPPVGFATPPPAAGGSHKKLWIAIAAAVAGILLVVAVLWALGVFGGGNDEFVGNWWALDDSGGLVIQSDLAVWIVDEDGTKAGPMQGEIDDDMLKFTLSDAALESLTDGDEATVLALKGKIAFEAAYSDDTGHLSVTTMVTGDVGDFADGFAPATTEFKRVTTLPTTVASASPSPTPTATISPSPSPSPSPTATSTGVPTPTTSPTGGSAFNDERVMRGADAIATAIDAYTLDNGAAPASGTVAPGGALETYLPAASWPVNPYTDAPMSEGSGLGSFTYVANADGSYSLAAHLGDGTDYTLP